MKTYEQIRSEIIMNPDAFFTQEKGCFHAAVSLAAIEEQTAKEYAKQWVVIAVAMAGIDRDVKKNELTISLINGKIDAQKD